MRRSSLSRVVSAPASRLLRAVPRPAGLALAATLGAAGLAGVIPAGPASAASGACTTSSNQVTCTFTETGSAQTWTVPAGVTSATFTLYGAEGYGSTEFLAAGGEGAEVTATLTVTPGTALQVNVGQVGQGGGTQGASFGGGGTGQFAGDGGGGGGASDIRTPASDGTYPLANRLLVAGGGGGGGAVESTSSGLGAGTTGGTGGNAGSAGGTGGSETVDGTNVEGGVGGGAGTTTAPGTGGTGGQLTGGGSCVGGTGYSGNPGVGAVGAGAEDGGGAGGGGYYGGGSGGQGAVGGTACGAEGGSGGGGGGSSYPAADVVGPAAAPGQSGNGEVIISYLLPLSVTTTSLPGGQVGTAYSQAVAATGGVTPYSWSVTSGSLPPGLTLDTSTGGISGKPTAYGTFDFTMTVTDSETPAMTASQPLSIVVKPAPLVITTTSLPAATGGQSYTAPLAATGGVTPYTWSVPPGTLPPGLTLDSSTGVISGVPDVAGTYPFTVTVTDSESPAVTAKATLSISVSGPVIAALRPDHGPSFGGSVVEITGTGLACPRHDRSCRVRVTFGGHRAFVLFASSTAIWVIAPPGRGTVQVTVTVGGVSSQATAAGQYTYEFAFFRFVP